MVCEGLSKLFRHILEPQCLASTSSTTSGEVFYDLDSATGKYSWYLPMSCGWISPTVERI